MDAQRDVVQDDALDALGVGLGDPQVLDVEHLGRGDGRLAALRGGQLGADHHLGELAGGDDLRIGVADRGAAPDDADRVGDGQHLVQLVRDEDDGDALGLELAQVVEQRVDLLRDQHGRGLVEDQDLGAAVQHLEDLDALAVGDAEVLDQGVRAHAQAVLVGDLLDLRLRLGADAVEVLAAEDDVLPHREVVGEHEVLVHHADAAGDGVAGGVELARLAVDRDGALVRLLHAVEDLHQRRLAGAVLAHQGVHGAGADGEVDVVVGHDTGEALGDAAQFDGRCRRPRAGGSVLAQGDGVGCGDGDLLVVWRRVVALGGPRADTGGRNGARGYALSAPCRAPPVNCVDHRAAGQAAGAVASETRGPYWTGAVGMVVAPLLMASPAAFSLSWMSSILPPVVASETPSAFRSKSLMPVKALPFLTESMYA